MKQIKDLFPLFLICLVMGTLIGAGFGNPLLGAAIGVGGFVAVILLFWLFAVLMFRCIIAFFDSISGRR